MPKNPDQTKKDLADLLTQAICRVHIANNEGDPILSAWRKDAERALDLARKELDQEIEEEKFTGHPLVSYSAGPIERSDGSSRISWTIMVGRASSGSFKISRSHSGHADTHLQASQDAFESIRDYFTWEEQKDGGSPSSAPGRA